MIETNVERRVKTKARVLGFVLAALLTAWVLIAAGSARAATTFTVNSTADLGDKSSADGLCDTGRFVLGAGPECTLRAAIQQANAASGADTINFGIPGTGVKTIAPKLGLPSITDTVTIDGYSQPDASENTLGTGTNAVLLVELSGANLGAASVALDIRASNSVVRGLVINRFGDGVLVSDGAGSRIQGNFIGTDPSGVSDLGNANRGVLIFTSNNTVGGASSEARNLISGNGFIGVLLSGATGTKVQGNLIGTKKSGGSALGNGFGGVEIFGASADNTVGGQTAGAANTIAFNSGEGVAIYGAQEGNLGNSVLRNSIFSNTELGIDLGDDGPTPNDRKDPDAGPNTLQNKPVLTSATTSSSATTVRGNLNSTPGTTFKIQFFSNPSGNEGKKFIGQKNVTTGPDGRATFAFSPAQRVVLLISAQTSKPRIPAA